MLIRHTLILVLLMFSTQLFSQLDYTIREGCVRIYDFLDEFELLDTIGDDGIKVVYPDSWELRMGSDGRMISYPSHWETEEGEDGRLVAFPDRWNSKMGNDGRVVPKPHYRSVGGKEEKWVKTKKSPNCYSSNPNDCYVYCLVKGHKGFDWIWSVGEDDRLVVVTTNLENKIKTDDDGRNFILLSNNWIMHKTMTGRTIASPPNWKMHEYEDGTFAMIPPFKSVETIFDIFEEENNLVLIFNQPYKTVLLQKMETSNDEETLDVALYWFLNEN